MRFFSRVPRIDFMSVRKPMLVFATLVTVLSIGLVMARGLAFGLDFTGGVLIDCLLYTSPSPRD